MSESNLKKSSENFNDQSDGSRCYADDYESRGYSRSYGATIDDLKDWFVTKLEAFDECVSLTGEQIANGTDCLPVHLMEVVSEAIQTWKSKGYELSYNQICIAFFAAGFDSGKIKHSA